MDFALSDISSGHEEANAEHYIVPYDLTRYSSATTGLCDEHLALVSVRTGSSFHADDVQSFVGAKETQTSM